MKAQEKADDLLSAIEKNTAVSGGMFLEKAMQQVKLDYSADSLKRIDALLWQINEKLKLVPDGLLEDEQKANFALTLAFYLGEYIARQVNKKIAWLDYAEALKKFPPDQTPHQLFNTCVIGFIGSVTLMPLLVLEEQLFNGKRQVNAQSFVEEAIELVQAQAMVNGDEWKPEYLDLFLKNQKVPGGVAYPDAIRLVKMDFSLESLDQMDELLLTIRNQLQPDYAQFMNKISSANLIWLLATYLARTSAHLAQCPLKWIDYQTSLSFDPDILCKFETTYASILGDRIYHPIMIVNQIIFSASPKISSRAFAEQLIASDVPRLVFLKPSNVIPLKPNASPPGMEHFADWYHAIRDAGFLAAHGAFMLEGEVENQAVILQPKDDGGHIMLDLSMMDSWESANSHAMNMLENNPENRKYQIYLSEAYANLPHARLDAMVLDVHCYTDPKLSLSILVPYTSAKSERGFKVFTPLLMHSTAHAKFEQGIATAFFEGAKTNNAFDWDKYYSDEAFG